MLIYILKYIVVYFEKIRCNYKDVLHLKGFVSNSYFNLNLSYDLYPEEIRHKSYPRICRLDDMATLTIIQIPHKKIKINLFYLIF